LRPLKKGVPSRKAKKGGNVGGGGRGVRWEQMCAHVYEGSGNRGQM